MAIWRRLPRRIANSFLHLIYPPLCLNCDQSLVNPAHWLCGECILLMQLIDPCERCRLCFAEDEDPPRRICGNCFGQIAIIDGMAAAFDFDGPPAALLKKMKYSNMPYLSKGAAAYMTAQLCNLEWPFPDLIVPVPISWMRRMQRGYNQSLMLAEEMGVMLQRPVCEALKRRSGDFSQAGLNREHRKTLESEAFYCKKRAKIEDKVLLLVDDVITTGATINRCAEALQSHHPKSIYALSFCRAL